eukprot:m.433484 g.433484  ORF g.433484 m.433484 type:complete len:245 (-) comp17581_c0_seq1:1445-2179(-)
MGLFALGVPLECLWGEPELAQLLRHVLLVQPAQVAHLTRAPTMTVHLAGLALEPLGIETPEERATVVAERRALVVLRMELVRDVNLEALLQLIRLFPEGFGRDISARAGVDHRLVALLVQDQGAQLALVALLPKPPQEVLAVRAESRLPKEAGSETMVVDDVDLSALHCAATRLDHVPFHKLGRRGVCHLRSSHPLPSPQLGRVGVLFVCSTDQTWDKVDTFADHARAANAANLRREREVWALI